MMPSSRPPQSTSAVIHTLSATAQGQTSQMTLHLTDAALQHIASLHRADPSTTTPFFRVVVESGGCSGFQYIYRFVPEPPQEDDLCLVVAEAGVTVMVDPVSAALIQGSTVDYVETMVESQFVVHNPNSTARCGCGNSFSL